MLYHLFIGVQKIYLYDNEDSPTLYRMFQCNPRVEVRVPPNGVPSLSLTLQVRMLYAYSAESQH